SCSAYPSAPLPPAPLCPYTTLFRSLLDSAGGAAQPIHSDKDHLLVAAQLLGGQVGPDRHGVVVPIDNVDSRLCAQGLGHAGLRLDRKSTRLNSSHGSISYPVFCFKK